MKVNFTKMQGLGNDFIVIDTVRQTFNPRMDLIQKWSDRNTGVGFDQLLLIEPAKNKNTDFFFRIFNADGSEVAQCGNGARCIMQYLHEEQLTTKNDVIVETIKGQLELQKINDQQYKVNMGHPNFDPKSIPFIVDKPAEIYCLSIQDQLIEFFALSIGNPHCVLQVKDVTTARVREIGSLVTHHLNFPEGTNVEFMQILNPEKIKLRVYERGTGETQACGSGSCAAVIAGRSLNLLSESVDVDLPGGHLTVKWAGGNNPVYLIGPATTVFNGTIIYD
jgi:diaminopimelate epimerase